ncbi:SH3 domain-containing protein [Adonisia turfae]|uniref:SH3 domain-containing protein n=1 Tax=Adonisia turfae CCMR0081 TaxID=2292702 RepID=A0A6M0RDQ8_9CYAN|nr:SH3 domain-containing protein [Adonisia turfae]NEZ54428.1 SH3 domain-containing protein [Adonisia turfae CCMR0081]
MFPENKHLETYLVSNQKTKSSPSVANITVIQYIGIVAISIPISVAVSFTLFKRLVDFSPMFEMDPPRVNTIPTNLPTRPPEDQLPEEDSFPSELPVPTSPTVIPDRTDDSGKISSDSIPIIYIDGYWIRIPSSCNGFHAGGANFRASPSLDASVIKGVVPVGERVFLTGETTYGDEIIWHRALNEALLDRSIEYGALNFLVADQEGWIANCFVEQL